MTRWAAAASIALGLVLLVGVGVRSVGDLPHAECSERLWLPTDGSLASSLVANHRSAIGCSGQTPNNATATRTTVTACAAAAAIASLGGIHLRRRPLAVAASVISVAFVVGLAAYMATDAPPLGTGLVIIGSLLGIVRAVRPPPS